MRLRRRCVVAGIGLAAWIVGANASERPVGTACDKVAAHIRAHLLGKPVSRALTYLALGDQSDGFLRIGPHRMVFTVEQLAGQIGSVEAARRLAGQPGWDIATHDVLHPPRSDMVVVDDERGTAHCHSLTALVHSGPGQMTEAPLTIDDGEPGLCGYWVAAISVDDTPAVLAERGRGDSIDLSAPEIRIATAHGVSFDLPCSLIVRYAVSFHAEEMYCGPFECGLLRRRAEALAGRRAKGASAEQLGNDAIPGDDMARRAEFERMKAMAEVPFRREQANNGKLDRFLARYNAEVLFPIGINDGITYLARLSYQAMASHDLPDQMLAVFRMGNSELVPVAGVSLRAMRDTILSAEARPMRR